MAAVISAANGLQSIYGAEIESLRRQGKRLAEVSCLADRRRAHRGFLKVFLPLSRLLAQFARQQGVDALLLAVHPRHGRFYHRALDFQFIGGEKEYPAVQNRPAVALELDFERVRQSHSNLDAHHFSPALPGEHLRPAPMPEPQRARFASLVDPCGALAVPGGVDSE